MKATLWLALFCTIGFLLILFFPNSYKILGFSLYNLIRNPWCCITAIFIHGNLEHYLSNLFVLLIFGLAVEEEMGRKKMLLIFFLGAFLGEFVSLIFYPPDVIHLGASAGIFALVATGMLVRPFELSFYPLIVPLPLALIGMLYAVYNAWYFFIGAETHVNYIAHFAGFFVGLVFGIKREGVLKSLLIIFVTLAILLAPLVLLSFLS